MNESLDATTSLPAPQPATQVGPTGPALGTLVGIGVGPGDPELITVKALTYLQQAPVVAFPAGLGGHPGVAQTTIAPYLRPHQLQLPLQFPYVQAKAPLQAAWAAAAEQVWEHLRQGRQVVFATEGDLSFYSTFTYLAQTLQQRHPTALVQAVAGVASPMAAAAALGIPLTLQGERLAVLPALYGLEPLEAALTWAEVVVLMKVGSVYDQVWPLLQRRGLLAHSQVVVHASRADQRIYRDLTLHPQLNLPYFSLLVVRQPPVSAEIR